MRSPEKAETRTYTIGQVADLPGGPVPTLRPCEREGLILPLRRDSGHRLYTDADCPACVVYAVAADCRALKSLLITLTTTS